MTCPFCGKRVPNNYKHHSCPKCNCAFRQASDLKIYRGCWNHPELIPKAQPVIADSQEMEEHAGDEHQYGDGDDAAIGLLGYV